MYKPTHPYPSSYGKNAFVGLGYVPAEDEGVVISTLLDDLVSYWALGEAGGTRYDSVGDNDLTDNNTVVGVAGKNGNAASLVGASNQSLGLGQLAISGIPAAIWTSSGWINLRLHANSKIFWGSITRGTVDNWTLDTGSTPGDIHLVIWDGEGTPINELTVATGAIEAWHHVVFGYDGANHFLSVDGAAPVTQAPSQAPPHVPASFGIGSMLDFSGFSATDYVTAYIDEVAFWNRALTSDECVELYNAGAGKFYPFE